MNNLGKLLYVKLGNMEGTTWKSALRFRPGDLLNEMCKRK